MSTVPGDASWRDAGLSEDDLRDVVDVHGDDTGLEVPVPAGPDHVDAPAEEYQPADPAPGEVQEASVADVVEQAVVVPEIEGDEPR